MPGRERVAVSSDRSAASDGQPRLHPDSEARFGNAAYTCRRSDYLIPLPGGPLAPRLRSGNTRLFYLRARRERALLGNVPVIDRFDWSHPRRIDRPLVEDLLSLGFVKRHENVLFRGPSGVGKTMLARCLGLAALVQGHTVRFSTLAAALTDLLKQESLPALERRLRRYVAPDLLLLDEVGYLPCDSRAADMLYAIVDRRHEKRSTVVTTNLSFKQWGSVFPGAACVVALVDRFAQHCHVVDIDADSWRQKNALVREPRDGGPNGAPNPRGRRRAEPPAEQQPDPVEF